MPDNSLLLWFHFTKRLTKLLEKQTAQMPFQSKINPLNKSTYIYYKNEKKYKCNLGQWRYTVSLSNNICVVPTRPNLSSINIWFFSFWCFKINKQQSLVFMCYQIDINQTAMCKDKMDFSKQIVGLVLLYLSAITCRYKNI